MTGWVVGVGKYDMKFFVKDIHKVMLLPKQNVYLLKDSVKIDNFKKAFNLEWTDPTGIVLNFLKIKNGDFDNEIKLQQPDGKVEVTVDKVDVREIKLPKKRAEGPLQLNRGLEPVQFAGEPKAWTTTAVVPPKPVDCKWSTWTNWSICGCDSQQTRNRTMTPPQFGGKNCTDLIALETRACALPVCPCVWNTWTDWSACSVTCGNGQTTRTRTETAATNGGAECIGEAMAVAPCELPDCPIDCAWGDWGIWSECDLGGKACGTGTMTHSRAPIGEKFGGRPCATASALETKECSIVCPPVEDEFEHTNRSALQSVFGSENVGFFVLFAIFLALVVLSLAVAIYLGVKAMNENKENNNAYAAY